MRLHKEIRDEYNSLVDEFIKSTIALDGGTIREDGALAVRLSRILALAWVLGKDEHEIMKVIFDEKPK
jgi:hypothetical protein